MNIRVLLQEIPTKPILFIAPSVVALVFVLYYQAQYKSCTSQAQLRGHLYTYLRNNINRTIYLTDAMPFAWDKAFILSNYKPDRNIPGCPFDWDWSEEERDSLVRQNSLNIIFFTLNNRRVNYIDFSNQQIMFENIVAEDAFSPETAKFNVELQGPNERVYLKRAD